MAKMGKIPLALEHVKMCGREVWLVLLMRTFETFGVVTLQLILVPFLIHDLKFSSMTAGLLYGGHFALTMSLSPLGGVFYRLMGSKACMILGTTIQLLGRLLITFGDSWVLTVVSLLVILPFASMLMLPLLRACIFVFVPGPTRPFLLGIHSLLMNMTAMCAGLAIDTFRFSIPGGFVWSGLSSPFTSIITINRVILIASSLSIAMLWILSFFLTPSFQVSPVKPVVMLEQVTTVLNAFRKSHTYGFIGFHFAMLGVRILARVLDVILAEYCNVMLNTAFPWGSVMAGIPAVVVFLTPHIPPKLSAILGLCYRRRVPGLSVVVGIGCAVTLLGILVMMLDRPTKWYDLLLFGLLVGIGEAIWSPASYKMHARMTTHHTNTYPFIYPHLAALQVLVGGALGGFLLDAFVEKDKSDSGMIWIILGTCVLVTPVLIFLLRMTRVLTSNLLRRRRAGSRLSKQDPNNATNKKQPKQQQQQKFQQARQQQIPYSQFGGDPIDDAGSSSGSDVGDSSKQEHRPTAPPPRPPIPSSSTASQRPNNKAAGATLGQNLTQRWAHLEVHLDDSNSDSEASDISDS